MHALAYDNAGFLKRTAANEFDRKRFPNRLRAELPVNIFEPRDRMAGQCDKNIADDDAGFVRRTLGLDLEDDGRGFVVVF